MSGRVTRSRSQGRTSIVTASVTSTRKSRASASRALKRQRKDEVGEDVETQHEVIAEESAEENSVQEKLETPPVVEAQSETTDNEAAAPDSPNSPANEKPTAFDNPLFMTPNPHLIRRGPDVERWTPTRVTRMEEKTQLQELNRRLEFLFVKMREREAMLGGGRREVDLVKQNSEKEIENLRTTLEAQINSLRATRDEQSAVTAQLSEEKTRQANLIKQLTAQLTVEKSKADELETELQRAQSELASTKNKLFNSEEDNKRSTHDLKLEHEESERLRAELDSARTQADEATSQLAGVESALRNLREDYDLLQKKHQAEVSELTAEVSELNRLRASIEDELRKEFGKQLQEILFERAQQYEEEKNEGIEQLRQMYDDKIHGYRDELEATSNELDHARAEIKRLQDELVSRVSDRSEQTIRIEIMEKKCSEYQTELQSMARRHQEDIAEKLRLIRQIKKSYKKKDEDFDALMDVKIALAMEIKAYRALLESEEDRLGYQPEIGSIVRPHDAHNNLYLSKADVDEHYIMIRNGSTETVSTRGWLLKSRQTGKEMKLPTVQVESGSTLTVWFGPNAADNIEADSTDLAWTGSVIGDNDEVTLVDPSRQQQSYLLL